jgi:hypothetical protein
MIDGEVGFLEESSDSISDSSCIYSSGESFIFKFIRGETGEMKLRLEIPIFLKLWWNLSGFEDDNLVVGAV